MRYIPYEDERRRNPYHAPEMAGPPELQVRANEDDVTKQPGTMAALLVAATLMVGIGFLAYGLYGPSPPASLEFSSRSGDIAR